MTQEEFAKLHYILAKVKYQLLDELTDLYISVERHDEIAKQLDAIDVVASICIIDKGKPSNQIGEVRVDDELVQKILMQHNGLAQTGQKSE